MEHARSRVRETHATHYPEHTDDRADTRICEQLDNRLARELVKPGNGRWS